MRLELRAYLAALPPKARRELQKMRAAIRAAAPAAKEHFSYGIPSFRLNDKALVWCAAWKHHLSLYAMGLAIQKRYAAELKSYKKAKGTIQFPLDEPLPVGLIKRLVKARVAALRKNT